MSDNRGKRFCWRELGIAEPLTFILGLALLGFGLFGQSNALNVVAHALDVRQWSVLVLTTVVATAVFAIYWLRIWRLDAEDPFNEDELFCIKRFLLATSVILVELWGGVVLSATEFPRYVWFQLHQLFAYGIYSHIALGVILGITLVVAVNVIVIIRWFIAFLNNRYV